MFVEEREKVEMFVFIIVLENADSHNRSPRLNLVFPVQPWIMCSVIVCLVGPSVKQES